MSLKQSERPVRWLVKGAAILLALSVRLIGLTLRLEIEDSAGVIRMAQRKPMIFAGWHNRSLFMMLIYYRFCRKGHNALALVSASRDGNWLNEILQVWGFRTARGSSSRRGSLATLQAMRILKDPSVDFCLTPDGPRGPLYSIQPGVVFLARLTQRPVIAANFHADWKWEFKSWDRFQVPLPFSRCRIVVSPPLEISREPSPEEIESFTKELRLRLGTDD